MRHTDIPWCAKALYDFSRGLSLCRVTVETDDMVFTHAISCPSITISSSQRVSSAHDPRTDLDVLKRELLAAWFAVCLGTPTSRRCKIGRQLLLFYVVGRPVTVISPATACKPCSVSCTRSFVFTSSSCSPSSSSSSAPYQSPSSSVNSSSYFHCSVPSNVVSPSSSSTRSSWSVPSSGKQK